MKFTRTPDEGELVCCKTVVGGHQDVYRGKVLHILPTEDEIMLEVFAVDYGVKNVVPMNCVTEITPLGRREPFQVNKSSLDSVGSSIDSVESSLDSVESILDSMESSLDSMESSLDSMESSLDSVESSLDSVESILDSMESSLDSVESSLHSVESSLDSVVQISPQNA